MHPEPPADVVAPRADWDRLSELFLSVLSVPPADRLRVVDQLAAGDAPLREDLASLLAAHDGAPAFLDALYDGAILPALVDQAPGATPEGPHDERLASSIHPGMRIRHVIVHEPVGGGGTGEVFRGRDTVLQRDVAIKVLRPALRDDPAARRRILREAQAASRLDDPNVCPIYAIETLDDGTVCLVMGFCAGGTLRDRLQRGPLTTAQILAIARDAASGLASAHRAGIVHGDIKPANIGFADHDVARLLDFGVAAPIVTTDGPATALAGTLPYLAPELWRGAPRTPATDVWALGVTLAEMLIGTRPFAGATAQQLAACIAAAQCPPLRRPNGEPVPAWLAQAVTRMLHPDPACRPADGEAVRALLTGEAARSPAPTRQAWRSAGLFLLGVIGLASAASVWARGQRTTTVASRPVEVAQSNVPPVRLAVLPFTIRGPSTIAYLSTGVVDVLTPAFDATGLVRGVDPSAVIAAAATGPLDSAAAQRAAARVQADRYVRGSVVSSAPALVLRATLHRADGREVGRASVTAESVATLATATEALVRQLIATELLAPGDTVASVAAAMTRSSRALRAYLDGERALRDARPAAAVAHFQVAVADDSAFALAWYRLARAARWSEVESVSVAAAAQAARRAATLPPRQRALVEAYQLLRTGSPAVAERRLQQLVRDYPTDVDGWLLLGEVQFTNHPYRGRPIAESATAFQRVMALDPRNREVTVYLMDLAMLAGRPAQFDTLFSMYFRPNSAGEQPGIRATYSARYVRIVPNAQQPAGWPGPVDDPAWARVALQRMGPDELEPRAAPAWAALLAATPTWRVDGLLALATLATARGDWPTARAMLDSADRLDPGATEEHRGMLLLAPAVRPPLDELRAARSALWRSPGPVRVARGTALTRPQRDVVRAYIAGLLSVRLSDAAGVRAAQLRLRRGDPATDPLAAPLAAALDGHWWARQRDWDRAAAAFAQSVIDVPARVRVDHPALAQGLDRWVHAEVQRARGEPALASTWAAALRESVGLVNAPYWAAAGRTP